ncbi:MAG: patatin-like phospholipase family protein [Myxococcales bacterium]|nr:patatin-like phospholipase family protein [Myxococcales bacterium]
MAESPRIALCLPGGGATGAMFQIGALAALEDGLQGLAERGFDLYLGTNGGASVAAVLAAGQAPARMYRAFLDPVDQYFPLERKHILKMDFDAWRRTLVSGWQALRHGTSSLISRAPAPSPAALWEELDRFYDTLPAGLFSLEAYERFLEDFFVRRGIPNSFHGMPRPLRIMAHDLDSGEQVAFGAKGFDHVPVTRACIATMAVSPIFSPVRIADRWYIDAGAAEASHLDLAVGEGAELIVVVSPMVPVRAQAVPTGHGLKGSLRDKGLMWVMNQSIRIGMHRQLHESLTRVVASGAADVLLIEPDPTDAMLLMHNPASFAARRKILEHAYRSTRTQIDTWVEMRHPVLERGQFRPRPRADGAD